MSPNKHHQATYSQIIKSLAYIDGIENHVDIPEADEGIVRRTSDYLARRSGKKRIIEPGCGPARLMLKLGRALPDIEIIGIDHDPDFVRDGQELIQKEGLSNCRIIQADINDLAQLHPELLGSADAVITQGTHHHIAKGRAMEQYLDAVRSLMSPEAIYLLGDEVLAPYAEGTREVAAIIWYCYVIACALKGGHLQLAREESKTLLDDLNEGAEISPFKSEGQVKLIEAVSPAIAMDALRGDLDTARRRAQELLTSLKLQVRTIESGEASMDLSRHDFKISLRELIDEVVGRGFRFNDKWTFGHVDTIGGMAVVEFAC